MARIASDCDAMRSLEHQMAVIASDSAPCRSPSSTQARHVACMATNGTSDGVETTAHTAWCTGAAAALQLHSPMENPYRSCERMTRVRRARRVAAALGGDLPEDGALP